VTRFAKILLLLSCVPAAAFAQTQPLETLHYRPSGKLIILDLTVNGKTHAWFCFDSGAYHSIIDPRLARELGLKTAGEGTLGGTGKGQVSYRRVGPITVGLGRLSIPVSDAWSTDMSGLPIAKDVRGIIGSDLLDRYVISIDPDTRVVSIFDPRTFVAPQQATALPIVVKNDRYFVRATLDVKPGVRTDNLYRIDTGSEDSFDDPSAALALHTHKTSLGNGFGANFEGVSGEFEAAHLGPYSWRDVWGPGGQSPAIGMEILRRFVVTFDVPHRYMYLNPNSALNDAIPAPSN